MPDPRPLILLVDDQPDVRFMLSLFLEDEQLEFHEASSGEAALERLAAGDYALMLLDQRMPPGMSGIEVAEQLRADGDEIPILLYSAFLDPAVEERARRLGLQTVAEWVQDEQAASILAGWGCDYLQGALVGLATTDRPWLVAPGANAASA